jgi:hypothetical protein
VSYTYDEYVENRLPDSLYDGTPYDDGVNDFYLGDGDGEDDYPREFDCE